MLVKLHSLKDRNNKNKPFLLLLGWHKISRLWATFINREISLPHVSYSLNAKKAVFKRQKQKQVRDSVGPSAKSRSVTASSLSNKELEVVGAIKDSRHSHVPSKTERVMLAAKGDGAKETGDLPRAQGDEVK